MLTKDQANLLLRALNALYWDGDEDTCEEVDDLADVDESDLVDALFALHGIAYGVDLGEALHEADRENEQEDAGQ